MGVICAIAVAYMWESSAVRTDGRLRVFFAEGVLTLDARLRNAFPKGKRAIHASSFVETAGRLPDGASFRPYSSVGSLGAFFRLLADPCRIYIVLDDKGNRLLTRKTCGPPALANCPISVTLVLGGDSRLRPSYCRFYRRHAKSGGLPSYPSVSDWGATAACLLHCCVFAIHGRRWGHEKRMRPHVLRRGAWRSGNKFRLNPTVTSRRVVITASGDVPIFGTPGLSVFSHPGRN